MNTTLIAAAAVAGLTSGRHSLHDRQGLGAPLDSQAAALVRVRRVLVRVLLMGFRCQEAEGALRINVRIRRFVRT